MRAPTAGGRARVLATRARAWVLLLAAVFARGGASAADPAALLAGAWGALRQRPVSGWFVLAAVCSGCPCCWSGSPPPSTHAMW